MEFQGKQKGRQAVNNSGCWEKGEKESAIPCVPFAVKANRQPYGKRRLKASESEKASPEC